MKTKLFSLFLVLVASVGIINASVTIDGIAYNLDANGRTAEVTKGGSYSGEVVIPSSVTYNSVTYSVTSIGISAFYRCTGLTSVTIGQNVTSIGKSAFSYCSDLSSVTIPNSVTSIGDEAFRDCISLPVIDNLRYADTYLVCAADESLTTYTIKEGTKWIGSHAFYGCSGLLSVTIPNSITSIGSNAFYNCSSLTSVTIPNSVTNIGGGAFYNCSSLTSVTIPSSVTSIGGGAFQDCESLTSIEIPNTVTSIGAWTFALCLSLMNLIIPSSVTDIEEMAFQLVPNVVYTAKIWDNEWTGARTVGGYVDGLFVYSDNSKTSLSACSYAATGNISIPNSVTNIGNSAFSYCSNLSSVTIPNSVTSIGDEAFSDCSGLTSVTIGNSVTSIGERTFAYCSGLTSITMPSSVTSISFEAFYNCSGLTSITCEADVPPTCATDAFNMVDKKIPVYVPAESVAAYKAAGSWKDFTNIRAIGGTTYYTLIFLDWDGTILKTDTVEYGQSATAPVDPTRDGYTFTGWDKDFSYVTSDLTVTAQYSINTYIVQFVDWDASILKVDTVEYLQDATSPAGPTREGYTFTGWDKDFSYVTSDLTVTALYKQNDSSMTCAEAREAALGGSTDEVSVIGYVTDILFAWDATYKNISFWMADNKDGGKVLEAYRINCATQAEAPVVGDKVKVTGKLTVYNSTTPEIDAGGTFEILERVSGDEVDDVTVTSPAEGYATIVINIPEGSECNGIAFKGTMDGSTWSSPNTYVGETKVNASTDECIKFTKIEGTRTWYKATYKLGTIGLIGKICLIYPDDNYWEGQAINYSIIDAKTTANASIDGDGNIVITDSGLAYIKINDWQDSKCAESITVRLQASSAAAWDVVKLFYWGDGICGYEWPGIAVTNTDGWYSYTFASSIKSVNIIWTDGEGDQTVDINDVTASTCYKLNSLSGEKRTVTIVDCSAGELPEDAMTCAEARDAALGGSTNEVTVIGYVTEYVYLWSSSFNSVSFWMADTKDGGKVFEAYRAKCETAAEAPNVGDKVKIVGKLSVYNQATPEISNGTFEILERTSEKTYYTIRFINWDGTELQSLPVEFATTPEYTGATPLRTDDEYYTYEFSGWTPTISPAIKDFTYKATYKGTPKEVHGQAEETQTTEVTATPTEDGSVVIAWPAVEGATIYTIEIAKNGEVICTLVFNENGQLLAIRFAAPARNKDGRNVVAATQAGKGWTYTVTGMEAGATYTYSVTAKDDSDTKLFEQSVQFTMPASQGIDDMPANINGAQKFIRNGQIFILRGEKTYTVTGQEVK